MTRRWPCVFFNFSSSFASDYSLTSSYVRIECFPALPHSHTRFFFFSSSLLRNFRAWLNFNPHSFALMIAVRVARNSKTNSVIRPMFTLNYNRCLLMTKILLQRNKVDQCVHSSLWRQIYILSIDKSCSITAGSGWRAHANKTKSFALVQVRYRNNCLSLTRCHRLTNSFSGNKLFDY